MANETSTYVYRIIYGPTHTGYWTRKMFVTLGRPIETEEDEKEIERIHLPKDQGTLEIKDWKRMS